MLLVFTGCSNRQGKPAVSESPESPAAESSSEPASKNPRPFPKQAKKKGIPVTGGTRLTEKFGGAIKNISIGLVSSEGKAWIYSGGTSPWGGEQNAFLESMAAAHMNGC